MSTYSDKLKDPRWQKKRLEILNRDEFTCQWCSDTEKTLHVHHLKYSGDPWEIEDEFLLTLCETCHEDIDMGYKQAGYKLTQALKSKAFAAEHLLKLATAIEKGTLKGLPHEPITDAIAFMFTDQQAFNLVYDRYFEYLKEIREAKKVLCQTES
jgi:hypothetical protein